MGHHQVKFVTFEYNEKWFQDGMKHTLQETQKWLYGLGYMCFWITEKFGLIPLFDMWWDPFYEFRHWSNVFCGLKVDPDLSRVFRIMNDDDESRAFATQYLAKSSKSA